MTEKSTGGEEGGGRWNPMIYKVGEAHDVQGWGEQLYAWLYKTAYMDKVDIYMFFMVSID